MASAAAEGVQEALTKVVGMGSCGRDYLAQVAAFPQPDDKLRTERLEAQGGGNCANALTAAARLGLAPALVSKIGGDAIGDEILAELQGDGVDTSHVMRAADSPSPFTYIIVDRQGGTRTCIHTPGAPLDPAELALPCSRIRTALDGAALVYFDGRLAEAALLLAEAARERGIPVLVEGERLRPGLDELLATADYVTTSAQFPQAWTGEAELGDAVAALLQRLPRARWVATTLGASGSLLVQRAQEGADGEGLSAEARSGGNGASGPGRGDGSVEALGVALERLKEQLSETQPCSNKPAVTAADDIKVGQARVVSTKRPVRLRTHGSHAADPAAKARAELAAAAAATANADAASAARYRSQRGGAGEAGGGAAGAGGGVLANIFVASAAALPKGAVVDTTGAGDAFVGGLLYGLCAGLPPQRMLALAAAAKQPSASYQAERPTGAQAEFEPIGSPIKSGSEGAAGDLIAALTDLDKSPLTIMEAAAAAAAAAVPSKKKIKGRRAQQVNRLAKGEPVVATKGEPVISGPHAAARRCHAAHTRSPGSVPAPAELRVAPELCLGSGRAGLAALWEVPGRKSGTRKTGGCSGSGKRGVRAALRAVGHGVTRALRAAANPFARSCGGGAAAVRA
ncbi:hypothetical protein WJX81_002155 [Elliptochloris bilobata]|uniref:Carbohydrate kinase PfkB domain-containing protein n=1 Tax=Elliptochloris bilobata TaxID=381761 RepID=A0AAW1SHE0_9CHLO